MEVGVDEAGEDDPPLEVDLFDRRRARPVAQLARRTDGDDTAVTDEHGLSRFCLRCVSGRRSPAGDGGGGGQRVHPPICEQAVGAGGAGRIDRVHEAIEPQAQGIARDASAPIPRGLAQPAMRGIDRRVQ